MATIEPFGDAAVLITLGEEIDETLSRRVHALAGRIRELRGREGRIGRPVPAFASVLVPLDPILLDAASAASILAPLVESVLTEPAPPDDDRPPVEIPTAYGGRDGPDLEELAATHDLSAAAVVELHASTTYRVAFLGFLPGFAYLGPLPVEIATPRRSTPRERVPAGSVGIADRQTGIYPVASPGGWQLIGRTDVVAWDPRRTSPALLEPGRRVRFVPVRRG